MIAPRWRKVLRDLWLHKPRTALVVLAIVIGITGAGAVLDAWSLVRLVTRDGYLATNPASATLRVDSVDAALLAQVRALPMIRNAEARRTTRSAAIVNGAVVSALLFSSADVSASTVATVVHEQGSWPPADGSVVIEHSSMSFASAGMGDTLTLQLEGNAPARLRVAGVARDQGLAPGWMDHEVYVFVSPRTLAAMGGKASFNQLQIVVRDGNGASFDREVNRRAAVEVKALVERAGHTVLDVDVPIPGRHMHAAQMDSLLMIKGAFGVLMLILSGFLVVNLMAAMLTGQVREIGVMKSIGARTSQIAVMYLAVAFALGVIACVIAIPLAAFVGRWYAEFAASLLNFSVDGVPIPTRAIVLQLVVGALLPVVAAAFPVMRGCGISVGESLRDLGMSPRDAGAGGGVLRGASGVARPLLLSLRNAFRKRQRMAFTLLTLAMGGAVFLAALDLRAGIRGSVGLIYDEYNKFDLTIRFTKSHAADSIEHAAARVAGVETVEAWTGARAAVDHSDGMLEGSFALTAFNPATKLVAYPLEGGRWLSDSGANELVVSKALLLTEPSLAVGSDVSLVINGQSTKWHVVGAAVSGPSVTAYASRATLSRVLGDSLARTIVVRTKAKDGAAQSELIQRLRDSLEHDGFDVESSQLMQVNRVVVEDHLLMVAGFLLVMAQLTVVVGGLGLASTMSLSILERTREIGVLRAIGARHSSILAMVQIEGLVISVCSWLLAIPLSLPISVALGNAFGKVMFPVATSWVPVWSGVAIWFGVVILVSVVACAWPAWRATRITTAAALAYE